MSEKYEAFIPATIRQDIKEILSWIATLDEPLTGHIALAIRTVAQWVNDGPE